MPMPIAGVAQPRLCHAHARLHAQGRTERPLCVIGVPSGVAEKCHEAVPDVLVERPTLAKDLRGHGVEKLVQQVDDLLRLLLLRQRREVPEVCEQDGEFLPDRDDG
jgi:hypothetical protein